MELFTSRWRACLPETIDAKQNAVDTRNLYNIETIV